VQCRERMILKRELLYISNICICKYRVLFFQNFHNKKWVHIMLEVSIWLTKYWTHEYIRYSSIFGAITHACSRILFNIP